MIWQQKLVLFGAAMLAGAVNSVAGGGTLLTFPALLWAGESAIIANATSTVALWPGLVSSLWGYRSEVGRSRRVNLFIAIPGFFGGLIGASLLVYTNPKTFERLIPYLILTATLLFLAQEPVSRWQKRRAERNAPADAEALPAAVSPDPPFFSPDAPVLLRLSVQGFLFLVSIYGGYFGAGIGVLTLAALGFMGFANIHRMNGLKNLLGLFINVIAALIFIVRGLVDWQTAAIMAAGAIVGGFGGAGTARRIGQRNVRRLIVVIGFVLAVSFFLRRS